jgi:polysaccharide export outer membrane protein
LHERIDAATDSRYSRTCRIASAVLLSGCLFTANAFAQNPGATTSPAPSGSEQANAPQTINAIYVGPGDLLDVEVFDTPELSGKLRVDESGVVTLPLGGHVKVSGLSTIAAAQAVSTQLRDAQILQEPSVSIQITEYATQGITVLGEVKTPGTYSLLGPHSLYDLLAAAGGPTITEGNSIVITHAGNVSTTETIKVDTPDYSAIEKTTMVFAGDTVVVSRAELVYVVGDVGHPGAFYMQNGAPLTVLDVVALAQGTTKTSAVSASSIVRKTATGAETIHFNLNKIMKNKADNFALLAGDIVVIPRSGFKDFINVALPGATGAVTSAVATALIVQ